MELDIYGVYLPGFFGLTLAAYVTTLLLRYIAGRTGFYALVWHRALFDFAVYLLVLAVFVSFSLKLGR